MEQIRLIIAIVLSIVIFLVWDFFFVKRPDLPPQAPMEQSEPASPTPLTAKEKAPLSAIEKGGADDTQQTAPGASEATVRPARIVTVDSPLYSISISERGAEFQHFVLKNYKETNGQASGLKELVSLPLEEGSVRTGTLNQKISGLKNAVFTSDQSDLEVDENSRTLKFSWLSPEGIAIEKEYTFHPDSYLIDLKMTVHNRTASPLSDQLVFSLAQTIEEEKRQFDFVGTSALLNGSLEEIEVDDLEEPKDFPGNVRWLAIQDRYFLSSIIPDAPQETRIRVLKNGLQNTYEAQYIQPGFTLAAGERETFTYHLFFGPKDWELLREIDYDLARAVHFGMFDFIAKPCLWIMNRIYSVIPNYGVAIILLTILTKVLLWPLGNKSYRSMSEMKKIQPLMAEIREKYKNDKKKMNEELMGLYRVYKINPLGGCLPMVLQIPVFFALYRMLYGAIELRHAPFFGWINDLSAPDRLFRFDIAVPLMEPPYGIPVLTLIMGATMFLQQKMSPPPGDPGQARMMMLMPLIFTFIFINFPAGLVLYWLINNIMSIGQQYYVTKKLA